MPPLIDLAGQEFGRLTVVERAENKDDRVAWLCECECGERHVVAGNHLRAGHTRSCGCLQREVAAETGEANARPGDASWRHYLRTQRNNAERRGIDFSLTARQVEDLSQRPCHYCGEVPAERFSGYVGNGIDRVDNDRGYVTGNAVPCCRDCNWAKGEKTLDEFTAWAARLATHLFEAED